MFTENFNDYVCDGDSITCEVDGYTVTAKIERDDDCGWSVPAVIPCSNLLSGV